jgi:hypothetical protein
MSTSTMASLLFCLFTVNACQSRSSGTPTPLADLIKAKLNVRAAPGRADVPGKVSQLPRIEAEVLFEDVGAMDESGRRCPVLVEHVTATIDGQPATFLERGGPVGQGAGKVEYYLCRPIRFVAALQPPFDRKVVVSLADATRNFRIEIDRLLDARGDVLPLPAEDKSSPRVIGCTGGLACNIGPPDPALVVLND